MQLLKMSLTMRLLLIFVLANDQLRLTAQGLNETCAGHEKWTVFQRRKYGNVDFNRGWEDYVNGFGDCDGDFWLGLEELHELTKHGDMSLEINMVTRNEPLGRHEAGVHLWAKYSNFRIGPGSDKYTLHVSGYFGNTVGDGLSYHSSQQFSTKDADHADPSRNCASSREGGWWYWECGASNLNGNFHKTDPKGIYWTLNYWWPRDRVRYNLCCSEMKIYKRP